MDLWVLSRSAALQNRIFGKMQKRVLRQNTKLLTATNHSICLGLEKLKFVGTRGTNYLQHDLIFFCLTIHHQDLLKLVNLFVYITQHIQLFDGQWDLYPGAVE